MQSLYNSGGHFETRKGLSTKEKVSAGAKIIKSKIEEVAKILPIDNSTIQKKLTQIKIRVQTSLSIAETKGDEDEILNTALAEFRELKQTEWVLQFAELIHHKKILSERLKYAKSLTESFNSNNDVFLMEFDEIKPLEDELTMIASDLIQNIKKEEDKKQTISNFDQLLNCFRLKVVFLIAKLSIKDSIVKITHRMKDKGIKKFEKYEIALENLSTEMDEKLSSPYQEPSNQEDVINKAREILEEIDIKVEKEIALGEISNKYNEFSDVLEDLNDSHQLFPNFDDEKKHVDFALADSREVIASIHKPNSPLGFNQTSQLFVATSGALTTLERSKNRILIKYGLARVEKAIEFQKKIKIYDGSPFIDFLKKADKLLREAEEKLTWGEEGKSKFLGDDISSGPIPPPMLPLSLIEKITSTYITTVSELAKKN